jgi:glucose-6-phosphate 1-dehydrogenase
MDYIKEGDNVIAFMSIPSSGFKSVVDPYLNVLQYINPTYVLEKPYGTNKTEFESLMNYMESKNMNVIFNDHYIGKSAIVDLPTMNLPRYEDIYSMRLILHEEDGVDDRMGYFDKVGIINDMYQSHVLLLYSMVIAQIKSEQRESILKIMINMQIKCKTLDVYDGYNGIMPTECTVDCMYEHIKIYTSIGKKKPNQKEMIIYHKDGEMKLDLSNTRIEPYDHIFKQILENKTENFLNTTEIRYMWEHVESLQDSILYL